MSCAAWVSIAALLSKATLILEKTFRTALSHAKKNLCPGKAPVFGGGGRHRNCQRTLFGKHIFWINEVTSPIGAKLCFVGGKWTPKRQITFSPQEQSFFCFEGAKRMCVCLSPSRLASMPRGDCSQGKRKKKKKTNTEEQKERIREKETAVRPRDRPRDRPPVRRCVGGHRSVGRSVGPPIAGGGTDDGGQRCRRRRLLLLSE